MEPIDVSRFLFPSFPAIYYCDYPLAEAVGRLEQVFVTRSFRECVVGPPLYGRVTEQEVVLYRLWMINRSLGYPMVFCGSFQQTETGVVLKGNFSLSWGSKLYLCFALGVLSLFTVVAAAQTVSRHDTP